jgi:hypothetical protein
MSSRWPRPRGARGAAILLAAGLLAGCGGAAASVVGVTLPTSRQVTKTQAVAYAHAVNLRAGDLPGFTSTGSEAEAPKPGRYSLEYGRCRGGVNPARRIADVFSPEFSAGRAFYGKIVRSTVEVWPTPAIVALNNTRSHSSRGQLASYATSKRSINRSIGNARGASQSGHSRSRLCPTHCLALAIAF